MCQCVHLFEQLAETTLAPWLGHSGTVGGMENLRHASMNGFVSQQPIILWHSQTRPLRCRCIISFVYNVCTQCISIEYLAPDIRTMEWLRDYDVPIADVGTMECVCTNLSTVISVFSVFHGFLMLDRSCWMQCLIQCGAVLWWGSCSTPTWTTSRRPLKACRRVLMSVTLQVLCNT